MGAEDTGGPGKPKNLLIMKSETDWGSGKMDLFVPKPS